MGAQPSITLCMIVKDEEDRLPRSLASVEGLVDEIVVVDTGSKDRTVELARSKGACVHHFEWCDDFAAARNESLKHATGDWILWMDADESLNQAGDPEALKKAVARSSVDAYAVPIRNFKNGDGFDFHYASRLFRRHPDVRFTGKVHENVDVSLQELGVAMDYAPFYIDHFGYAIDEASFQEKLKRNLVLLQRQLAENPADAFVLYYLALTHLGLKNQEQSYAYIVRALEAPGPSPNVRCLVLNLYGFHLLFQGRYEEAAETARESLDIIPAQNTARIILGLSEANLARHSEALPHLFHAYQFLRSPMERRASGISQEQSVRFSDLTKAIAIALFCEKRYVHAIAFFQRTMRESPEDLLAALGLALSYLHCGNLSSAGALLDRARFLGGAASDGTFPWFLFDAQHFEDLAAAREAFRGIPEALMTSPHACALLQRVINAHLESGELQPLLRLLTDLGERSPLHPLILDATGFLRIKRREYDEAEAVYRRLCRVCPDIPDFRTRLRALQTVKRPRHTSLHRLAPLEGSR